MIWVFTYFGACVGLIECIIAHDIFWDIIVTIALENGTHVQREVSHLFLHHT
jgi:hypothetical protein